ncbi:hypothetical protein ElyMa_002042900 [Elysia marginata]|uniref:Uncharacterized protein n=1 Tax=Elysia marginata TaxID=1093978 RepID=A0AAV4FA16_9GAST|nr:hypothetical protein ElyMa_002042900 [Elysia marginata]
MVEAINTSELIAMFRVRHLKRIQGGRCCQHASTNERSGTTRIPRTNLVSCPIFRRCWNLYITSPRRTSHSVGVIVNRNRLKMSRNTLAHYDPTLDIGISCDASDWRMGSAIPPLS